MRKRKLDFVSVMYVGGEVVDNLRSNDSDGEASRVEPAGGAEGRCVCNLVTLIIATEALSGVAGPVANGSVDIAGAARCTIASENGNGDHSTAAENVKDQAEKGEEGLAAKAAGEDNCGDGIEDSRTGHALYGLLPTGNGDIAVSLN